MTKTAKLGPSTLNLIKLCVGAQSIEDLARWQASNVRRLKSGGKPFVVHTTFQAPKRQAELIDGGSLYWVIKGTVLVRQALIGFSDGLKEDGSACCLLHLDLALVPVRPTPRRPFQGWRYLTGDDAPPDLGAGSHEAVAAMPATLRKELAALGLL